MHMFLKGIKNVHDDGLIRDNKYLLEKWKSKENSSDIGW